MLIIATAVIIIFFRKKIFSAQDNETDNEIVNQLEEEIPVKKKPCVICGSLLNKGEKIKSKEIIRKEDSIVYLYGCHNCYGDKATAKRKCPVCGEFIDEKSYLIGRMWIKKNGKKHLRVAGCRDCGVIKVN